MYFERDREGRGPSLLRLTDQARDGRADVAPWRRCLLLLRIDRRHVVFALGATCTPTIPQQLASLYGKCCSCTGCSPAPTGSKGPKILHSYSWQKLQALPLDDQTVVVIGGGLSAVQSVLLAARRGAKQSNPITFLEGRPACKARAPHYAAMQVP